MIEKFPQREVAYLNLGDLYAKKGLLQEAALAYQSYIKLMAQRKLEHKVPVRVREFVGRNKGR